MAELKNVVCAHCGEQLFATDDEKIIKVHPCPDCTDEIVKTKVQPTVTCVGCGETLELDYNSTAKTISVPLCPNCAKSVSK